MARPRSRAHPADNPADIHAVIAAQVATLRERQGWSQARLAEELGSSTSVVQQLETGARAVSVEELLRLAYTLDVSPADLIGASYLDTKQVPLLGRLLPRRRVRAWAAGEPGATLPGMDGRRYSEQVSDDDYLARKRVAGLEDLHATLNELRSAAVRGSEAQIDDSLRALEAQVSHVRRTFGRKRGRAAARAAGSGTAEVIHTTSEEGENDAS